MAVSPPISVKSGFLLFGVIAAAAGLNLSVMSLGAKAAESDDSMATLPFMADGPDVRQVVVDVPVPGATTGMQPGESALPPASDDQTSSLPPAVAPPTSAATMAAVAPPTTAPTPAAPPNQAGSAVTTAAPAPVVTSAPASPPPTTAASASTAATTTPVTTTSGPNTEYLSYTFEGVAEIVVAYHDGQRLEFWSATPVPGWAYVVEKDRADVVELKFRRISGGEGEAKFELIRRNGRLDVKTER